jgi:hypothetical protein
MAAAATAVLGPADWSWIGCAAAAVGGGPGREAQPAAAGSQLRRTLRSGACPQQSGLGRWTVACECCCSAVWLEGLLQWPLQ